MSVEGRGSEGVDGRRNVGARCFDRDVIVVVKVDPSGLFMSVASNGKELAF